MQFTVGGTASFGTDYAQIGATSFTSTTGSVKIPAGSNTATVTVDPTADTTVERDETVVLSLSAGTGYSVGTQAAAATGTIANDDTATFTINNVTVDEGAGTMQFTVSLSNPIDTVAKVNVNFIDVTTNSADFDHAPRQVTFAANTNTPQTVTVPIVNDTIQESTETFTASLQLDPSTPLTGYATDLTDSAPVRLPTTTPRATWNSMPPHRVATELCETARTTIYFRAQSADFRRFEQRRFTFVGTSGDDQLTLDYSGGDPVPSGGFIFNGGSQTQNGIGDVLRISGSAIAPFTPPMRRSRATV